ncbi:hypothetical protein C8N35_106111 [Breoghania corrubedonensis]|uniref:Uncharacterized protein n=1 Tax=Breoghania corrubedonensis TaxID=665038 RepID=A0A2T5V7L4_9HYPH|nr:hypothetical protein [Breoghania corrubedonensis]PTW59726.1 hypothetical protein C8N35_106111 [Breoghania corrubedonensis]
MTRDDEGKPERLEHLPERQGAGAGLKPCFLGLALSSVINSVAENAESRPRAARLPSSSPGEVRVILHAPRLPQPAMDCPDEAGQ